MTKRINPFIYESAGSLDEDSLIAYYIDDYNFARVIRSKRNVFLVGERGAGKSMALRYNSFTTQLRRAQKEKVQPDYSFVGVFIPCNTMLTHKQEYKLLDDFRAAAVSEHYLVLQIAFELVGTLADAAVVIPNEHQLRADFEFITGFDLPEGGFYRSVQLLCQRENRFAQKALNTLSGDFYDRSVSFASFLMPLLRLLQQLPMLAQSHFMLMIDDAQYLNEYQIRALNSWIAYREHGIFSFKVTTTKVDRPSRTTGTGGSLLEGHDFITIDMERPLHFEESDYGRFARRVIETRLERIGITAPPEQFFPPHPEFEEDLAVAEEVVRAQAEEKYPDGDSKKIRDYIYRYKRAEYFRTRNVRANRPVYAGFTTIVYLSTGVVRNLLEPCWWMYDEALSGLGEGDAEVRAIAPTIQSARIHERSGVAWEKLRELDNTVEGCSRDMGQKVYALFDHLATYFHHRLMNHRSEPAAISFSISERDSPAMEKLEPLLSIAQKAQMLYTREGPAKDDSRRETYYVPNRMLWPKRGLDPHGQHARASIRSSVLLAAAEGRPIPVDQPDLDQGALF